MIQFCKICGRYSTPDEHKRKSKWREEDNMTVFLLLNQYAQENLRIFLSDKHEEYGTARLQDGKVFAGETYDDGSQASLCVGESVCPQCQYGHTQAKNVEKIVMAIARVAEEIRRGG